MRRDDLTPLGERLGAVAGVRAGMVLVVLTACGLWPETLGATASALMPVSLLYLVLAAAAELSRRTDRAPRLAVVTGMLLVDGLWVAVVLARTGGSQSSLVFLVDLHVVAVTLLLTWRTGLKLALWHGLLLFVTYYAQVAHLIAPDSPIPLLRTAAAGSEQTSVLGAAGFWLVALAAAGFSSLSERELRRGKDELRSLAEMGARMDEVQDVDEIRHVLRDAVAATFTVRRVVVVEPDELPPAGGRGAPQLLRRVDPDTHPALAAALPGGASVVVLPLAADGECFGALAAEWAGRWSRGRISRQALDMLTQFARHGALALRTATLLVEVKRLASTDALSGLANRRVFEAALQREVAEAERRRRPCSLVILDIDHFKSVNDTHGHQVGDAVIETVGRALARSARAGDLPARYGGEEFVVVLRECSAAEAQEVAERLRAAVAAEPGPVPITASAGVATFPANAADASSLVKAADAALYQSKAAGRDRTTRSRKRGPRLAAAS